MRAPSPRPATVSTNDRLGPAAGGAARGTLLALALLPLVFVPGMLFPYVVPRAAALRLAVEASAAVFLPLLLMRPSRVRDARDPFLLFLAGYVGWSLAAALAGPAPWRSVFGDLERMEGLVTWGHALLLYVLLRSLFRERHWRRFFVLLLVAAAAVSVWALAARWTGAGGFLPGPGGGRAQATLGSPGYLAAFLLLAAGALPWIWRGTGARPARIALAVGAAAGVAAFVLAGSRAATAGAGLAVAGTGAAWSWRRHGALRTLAGAALLALLAVVGLRAWAGVETGVGGLDRLLATDPSEKSLGSRLLMWEGSLRGAGDRLLFGVGPENFRLVADRHLPAELYRRYGGVPVWDRAHNVLVGALTTRGVPGLLLYLGTWAALLRNLALGRRAGRLDAAEATALAAAVTAFGVYLLFWFEDLTSLTVWIALAAFARHAAAGGRPLLEVDSEARGGVGRIAAAAGAVIVVAATAWTLAVRPLLAAREAGRAGALEARVPAGRVGPGSLEAGRQARILEHYRRALARSEALGWKILVRQIDRLARLSGRRAEVGSSPELARAVGEGVRTAAGRTAVELERDGENARVHLKHNQLLRAADALTGREGLADRAVEAGRRAVELAPARVGPRLALAATLLDAGRGDEALVVLRAAESAVEDYGPVDAHFARVHLSMGRPAAARDRLLAALRLGHAPSSPGPTLRVGAWLRDRGPAGEEAALYASHLAVRRADPFGRWAAPGVPVAPPGRDPGLRAADLPVLGRLPPALLRAGDREGALAAARSLLEQALPRLGPSVEAATIRPALRFLEEVGAGSPGPWRERTTLLPGPGGGAGEDPDRGPL